MQRYLALSLAYFLVTFSLTGCGTSPMIQVDTVIQPDGSCSRQFWQPKAGFLPDDGADPAWNARWTVVEAATTPPVFAAEGADVGEDAYLHAQGSFDGPDQIPDHFRKPIADRPELGAGETSRSYQRRDYGLFVEHSWSETFTNGVTRESFEQAREAFLDLSIPMLTQGVETVYGAEFDVTAAVEELKRRGRPLARDLIDAWYEAASVEDPREQASLLQERFADAMGRAGVDLRNADGEIAGVQTGDQEAISRIRAFLAERIQATFRGKSGAPLEKDQIETILASLNGLPYSDAWSSFSKTLEGDYNAKLVPLIVKMTGYYAYPPIFGPPAFQFAYSLRLPGEIEPDAVNGHSVLSEPGLVTWRFGPERLFPNGYTMHARSLDVDLDAQRQRFGRVVIPDSQTASQVRNLVLDEPSLKEALQKVWVEGNLELLQEASEATEHEKMRLAQLKELLRTAP